LLPVSMKRRMCCFDAIVNPSFSLVGPPFG
jgi:hypothetical protein